MRVSAYMTVKRRLNELIKVIWGQNGERSLSIVLLCISWGDKYEFM